MASPGLGLLLALGLPLLPAPWDQAWGQTLPGNENSTITPTNPNSNGGLSQDAITAIIVVFSILGVLVLAVLLALLVWKLREKRQTEGTYRPSSEEQVGARAPPHPNLKLPPEERLI
ncbi:PREDICTED: protein crumbs homolog 3 [Elephantulus edwardii]|uniref:protein crumbs homolog 3 n=1 Tax=Elephantulus edwardii TaxID=28737 RepID=UPI0003F0CEC7|nr:PREDICTED: protein crumbs homolog 3 [Elephantulus edwardii]